jgi:HemY protein
MKKWITFILLILLVAVAIWLGVQLQQRPGYLLITYENWNLEAPLWVAALSLLGTILVAYFVFRLVVLTFNLPYRWQRWARQRRQQKSSQYTLQGLRQLLEGNWQAAERRLTHAQRIYPQVWVNYLATAVAAHRLGAFERRDVYLQKARQSDPQAATAIDLAQAQFYIQQREWEEASRILQAILQEKPHHAEASRLLAQVYEAQQNWGQLHFLLLDLNRDGLLAPELERLTQQTYCGLLTHAMNISSPEQVAAIWQEIPKPVRNNVQLINCYADFLIQHQPDQAEHFLRDALKYNWHPDWVRRYGLTRGENNAKQLALAESWLKDHPDDPDLLFCLARLCVWQRLWGKARHYFETSLKLKPTAEGYYEWGELLEQLDEKPAAFACYRKGLELARLGDLSACSQNLTLSSFSPPPLGKGAA